MTAVAPEPLGGPRFVRYFGPVLRALDELGGSGRPAEVSNLVAEALSLSAEELAVTTANGASRFRNHVAWARFYLAKAGHIDSSQHGVWALTDTGRALKAMSHAQAMSLFHEVHSRFQNAADVVTADDAEDEEQPSTSEPEHGATSHRELLAATLLALSPAAFERFSQRLLREAGFEQVSVTGRSGDGGIDGIGILQVNALVSFKVLFQCKRYTGSVSPSQVRDFRGAMQGRADKGIILTTGTFTAEAQKEGTRDGVPPIELIDGEKIVDMCESLELGLRKREAFDVDEQFFREFD